ncbi:MAG: hypothetical protein IIA68_11785, partial [Proteobacteria bacterium]|nr:hypothetical protein [Pseudomonadota bacterium]
THAQPGQAGKAAQEIETLLSLVPDEPDEVSRRLGRRCALALYAAPGSRYHARQQMLGGRDLVLGRNSRALARRALAAAESSGNAAVIFGPEAATDSLQSWTATLGGME